MYLDQNVHDNLFSQMKEYDAASTTQHIVVFLRVDEYHMFHILYISFILFYIFLPS
jgi:hypothetical protein